MMPTGRWCIRDVQLWQDEKLKSEIIEAACQKAYIIFETMTLNTSVENVRTAFHFGVKATSQHLLNNFLNLGYIQHSSFKFKLSKSANNGIFDNFLKDLENPNLLEELQEVVNT